MLLYPFILSILAATIIELFFSVIKYRDSLNNNRPFQSAISSGYIALYQPVGYMSVTDFLSGGERRWLVYFVFRYTPHVIILVLLAAVLQDYFQLSSILPYLLLATSISVASRNFVGFLKARFLSERLLHAFNALMLYVLTLLVWLLCRYVDISFIAPSVDGMFDNLWSSLLVAISVLLYAQITNPFTKERNKQAEEIAKDNYVIKSYNYLKKHHGKTIESACNKNACSKPILYAVLIYENMNRPAQLRKFENLIVKVTRLNLTVGIAQVRSDKPLSDEESIKKAATILSGSVFADSGYGSGFVDIQQLEQILEKYNSSALYAESVAEIMSVLRRYTSDVFPESFGGAIGY